MCTIGLLSIRSVLSSANVLFSGLGTKHIYKSKFSQRSFRCLCLSLITVIHAASFKSSVILAAKK